MTGPSSSMLRKIGNTWYLWLFPMFAIVISAWLFWKFLDQQGPEVEISFEDAATIQEEKTHIRFRGVTIGSVKNMKLSDDNKSVVVTAILHKSAKNFAKEGAQYWLVTPEVGFQGIRGLETIFEGPYISALPGSGKTKSDFHGQIGKGIDSVPENTTPYLLETPFIEAVGSGDPVSYRGLNVGSVTKVSLSKTAQSVLVQINIQNRYTKLVRTNTVFWRKPGVQANLGLFKSEVKINSLESLLKGGIEFFTPDTAGPIAKARARFALFPAPPQGWEKWNPVLEFEPKTSKEDMYDESRVTKK